MARFEKKFVALVLAFSMVALATSQGSPGPAPYPAADSPSIPSPAPNAYAPISPTANEPTDSSPPSPPPYVHAPSSSPTPTPTGTSTTPAPSHSADDVSKVNPNGNESKGSSSLNGGKKAGIAIGVILAAGLVVVGGFVYKKRRDNVRRSQYGYAARREIL